MFFDFVIVHNAQAYISFLCNIICYVVSYPKVKYCHSVQDNMQMLVFSLKRSFFLGDLSLTNAKYTTIYFTLRKSDESFWAKCSNKVG